MSYRKKNILGAAALAILAVILMVVYSSKAHSGNATKKEPTGHVSVLVATRNIEPGTPGNDLQRGALAPRTVAADAAPADALTSASTLRGLVVRREIVAGRPVSEGQFGPAADSGVRIELRGKERVVQLEGDKSQVLDGTLRHGDHVDIVGSWDHPESCGQCHVSRTIVRNALVLSTSAELGKGSSTTTVPVQLRVTDSQARRVFWMAENGKWWLELRPVVHPNSSGRGFDNSHTIFTNGLPKQRSKR
jgi:Flp pilus assembly protein CpaB